MTPEELANLAHPRRARDLIDREYSRPLEVAALLAKGAMNGVHFQTDDLDGIFEKLRAAGVEIVEEPKEQPWGTRDYAVRDAHGS